MFLQKLASSFPPYVIKLKAELIRTVLNKRNSNQNSGHFKEFSVWMLTDCQPEENISCISETYSTANLAQVPQPKQSLKYSISLDMCFSSHLNYNTIYNACIKNNRHVF